ncbi:MAG: TonB-dependent receptor [Robiginitomaculum sp.]|nr:TonB-dependent receptor [Robiginitomaculum sp.]
MTDQRLKKYKCNTLMVSASIIAMSVLSVAAQAQQPPATDGSENVNYDEIVVVGVKRQLQEADAIEREADTIISVITANDVGQFPDQNIAEALQRLPGVTIIDNEGEGRFISVRGLDSSFVQVTVNGAQLGSSSGGSGLAPSSNRSVALDVISSDLLSKVNVGKTLLPDTDHDSLGAKVDLRPLSAFDRSEAFTGKVLIQGNYVENAETTNPKLAADFTYRADAGAGEFGIAGAINYSERAVSGDEVQSGSGGGLRSLNGFLAPQEIDQRSELGQRERLSGTVTMDYRVGDDHSWNFGFLYGRLHDNDIQTRQEIELRDSRGDEIISISQGAGRFSDVDIERRVSFRVTTEETYALHFEGSNRFADAWTLGYAIDYSKNTLVLDGSINGQFRERDAIVDATWGEDFATWTYVGRGENDGPGDNDFNFRPDNSDFDFDDISVSEESRNDEIFALNANIERDFNFNGRAASIKMGGKLTRRDRVFLRGENDIEPEDIFDEPGGEFVPETLAGFTTFTPPSSLDVSGGLGASGIVPEIEAFRALLLRAAEFADLESSDRRRDFTVTEDIDTAFVQGKYELSDKLQVIAGVRVEKTTYEAEGTVTRTAQFTDAADNSRSVQIPGAGNVVFVNEYTNVLPGVHFRYNASEDVVARLSYSKGQVRPGFGSASPLQSVAFEFIEPDGTCAETTVSLDGVPTSVCVDEAEFEGGNPRLEAITADQFDFNVGWYPSSDTTFTFAAFYKDISNAFVQTSTTGLTDELTGIPYTTIEGVINAEQASLYGIELAGRHFFTELGGFWGNTFVTGNISLIDSSVSDPNIRGGESFRLPFQTNVSANASIGYESEKVLVRLSLNHRGNQLRVLNLSDSNLENQDLGVRDVLEESITTLGLTGRYQFNDRIQLFSNVSNITNAVDVRTFRGDANGRIFEETSNFGRVFTFGLVATF